MAYEYIDEPGRYEFIDDEPEKSLGSRVAQHGKNALGGFIRGAGSIGATIASPFETSQENDDRRARIDTNMAELVGADPESLMYKGFKLGGEVAGTAGAGGVVANGLIRAAPVVARAAPAVANLMTKAAPAIQSGGLTLGANAPSNAVANLLLRSGGGVVNGGVSAGMVNQNDFGEGAMYGGALPGAIKVAKSTGGALKNGATGAIKHALGMTTGTGGNSVATAYKSGLEGGTSFLDNMRGDVPMTDVLDSAKSALGKMRLDRSAQYKAGMAGVSADKSVIDFAPIDKAVASIRSMGNYKGQVINKNASGTVDEISDLVSQWKGLDPAEFHTPEGLDALKQAISDVRDTTQFNTAARKAADTAYNAVKNEITAQAPTYSKVMKDYSQASETLSEVERALSLGNKAAADTSMRKLQSLMRNNVNTNFGNRLDLAKTLEQNGADILPAVAGQSMSSWTPRGLAGLAGLGTGASALATLNPGILAALPFSSPRLMGEAAYGLGSAGRGLLDVGGKAGQQVSGLLGRMNAPQLTAESLAPWLSTSAALYATQR